MRYIIYGAGAVGGAIGGRLFQAGRDVVLIARGAHLSAIRANGLTLESPDGRDVLPIPAVGGPGELSLGRDDVVVLAMKSQDTPGALAALEAAGGQDSALLIAQNGVENERAALRRFARVYTTTVMLPATHLEPGVVQANSAPMTGILDIGRYPGGVDAVAEAISADLGAATFSSHPEPDAMAWKYQKLLLNLGNAVQAICGEERSAAVDDLQARAKAEAVACFRAAGIPFVGDEADARRRGRIITVRPIAGATRGGGSTWQSIQRGKLEVESDYLNGEVVLLGRLHGVPTPVNELLRATANRHAREGVAPGTVSAAELLARLG